MNESIRMLLIICPLIFAAGFVDAVAGGGGLISLPGYMLAGLPAHQAAGCNKFSACLGTVTAAVQYIKSGKVKFRIAVYAAIGCMIGAGFGSTLALIISERALKVLMMIAIPCVAFFMVSQKNIGRVTVEKEWSNRRQAAVSLMTGLVIGCYDGFIGPGTGTFLIIAFSTTMGIDLVTSSGCAKVANLASNITSMVIYIIGGKVLFYLALPAAVCSVCGGWLGARFAVKGGTGRVRYIMFLVIGLLFAKSVINLLS